jgi:ankyrin repeat protein
MDVGRMLLDLPVCSFVSDLQREAKCRFVPDVAYTPCLGGEISQDALNVEALHGNRTRCELAVISNPQMLEYRFNSSDVRLSGCTALHLALMKGHESTARLLLSYRADVNATYGHDRFNQFGVWFGLSAYISTYQHISRTSDYISLLCGLDPVTPLLRAAENGQLSVARLLLEFRADLHARNCCGKTALMVAASQGHASIINLLLAQCSDVNERTFGTEDDGHTALMIAASEGHAAIVGLLLQQRADANAASNSGQTALMESAAQGNLSILQLLIEHGAEIDAANKDGRSAFIWASLGGHDSVMRHLIRHKACISPDTLNAKLDCDGNSLLLWATSRGQESTVRLLLEQHADVNATDAEGRSAILEAADKGHEAIFRLLLEYGADVNVADVNVTDDDGSTLLILAICNGDLSLARLLLEHGANVNSMNKIGNTALMRAAYLCQVSTVSLLIQNHADVNARNHHWETALMWACGTESRFYNQSSNDFEMARRKHDTVLLLLQSKADPNIKNRNGLTALGHCSLARSYRNDRWEKHLQRILQVSAFKSPIDFSDPRLAFDWGPGSLSDEDEMN